MKKRLLFCFVVLLTMTLSNASAQGLFEDFSDVPTDQGLGDIPDGWAQYNLDGLTPASNVSFIGNYGWRVVQLNSGDKAAVSVSWYAPAGMSNDWLVTPEFVVDSANSALLMDALNVNGNFRDQFELRISTDGDSLHHFTDLIGTYVPEAGDWNIYVADLSAYIGDTVHAAFVNNSNDKLYMLLRSVETVSAFARDMEVEETVRNIRFLSDTMNRPFAEVTLNNYSVEMMDSALAMWTFNGDTVLEAFTGLAIGPYGSNSFFLEIPFNVDPGEEVEVDLNLFGEYLEDSYDNNETQPIKLTGVFDGSSKNVFIEEGTGTWCTWCPRGFVAVENTYDMFDDVFIVAVHNDDPMVLEAYDDEVSDRLSGYPGVVLDRFFGGLGVPSNGNTTNFGVYRTASRDLVAPTELHADAIVDTSSVLTIEVEVTSFFTSDDADIRLAAVIKQDGLTGTGEDWDQINAYSGGGQGPMGGWENLPNPVPASQMVYDHVAVMMLGGYGGTPNSLPDEVMNGESYEYTYTVDASELPDLADTSSHFEVIVLVIDEESNRVINSYETEVEFEKVSATTVVAPGIEFDVYPTITQDQITIDYGTEMDRGTYQLNIYDWSGKVIAQQRVNNPFGAEQINVSEYLTGRYIVELNNERGSTSRVFIKE